MFYGQMPQRIPVEQAIVQLSPVVDGKMRVWWLWIRTDAKFARVKRLVLRKVGLPLCLRVPRFKPFFTVFEVFLAN
jgi:hypothetical protein